MKNHLSTSMKKKLVAGLLLGASSFLVGCEGDPTFTARTTAPPGAVADYYEDRQTDKRTIKLTEGLAYALECTDGKNRPCTWEDSSTSDASIATARRAYGDLDQEVTYQYKAGQTSQRTRMLFVVTAHKPGETTLTVKTGTRWVDIKIDVVAAN